MIGGVLLESYPKRRPVGIHACYVPGRDGSDGQGGEDPNHYRTAGLRAGLHPLHQPTHPIGQEIRLQLFAMFRFHAAVLPFQNSSECLLASMR